MFSTTLSKLTDPEAADAIVAAVEAVAERSFFAVVDRCEERLFTALASSVPRWLVATVRFEDGPLVGSMSCTLPEDLAHSLFDAFSGRDPSDPAPTTHQLYDLVGEFSNMVCGALLSRCAGDRSFRLGPPLVAQMGQPAGTRGGRVWVALDNRPMAVDLRLQTAPHVAMAAVGA